VSFLFVEGKDVSLTSALASPLFQIPPIPVRRFSVAEFMRFIELGLLADAEKIELLDGWITPKMPRNPPHDSVLAQVDVAIAGLVPAGWHLRRQSSVLLPTSVPEPDHAIVRGQPRQYRNQHPGPADVALLIEVADSSLDHDRDVKGPLYAAAGIPIYWIANLVDLVLEVYTSPAQGGYQNRQDYTVNDVVPLVIAGQTVAQVPVADLIG
jgi:Uma2 family endonuclease